MNRPILNLNQSRNERNDLQRQSRSRNGLIVIEIAPAAIILILLVWMFASLYSTPVAPFHTPFTPC